MTIVVSSQTQTSADTQLQQYIKELQASPEDLKVRREIREKIIKLVATMPSRPALPPDAEKHGFKAEYLAKSATTSEDFSKVADEYSQAAMLAPWVAEYYQNLGIALDKYGDLENAKDKFELYLLSAPNASDRADVRRKIAELEVRIDQAAEAQKQAFEAKNAAAAAQEKYRREYEGWIKFQSLVEGKVYQMYWCSGRRGEVGCNWDDFSHDSERNVWSSDLPGTGGPAMSYFVHWVVVGDAAYLTYPDGNIQDSRVSIRVVAVPGTSDAESQRWEQKISHDYGRTYAWEDLKFLRTYSNLQVIKYGVGMPADPMSTPKAVYMYNMLKMQ